MNPVSLLFSLGGGFLCGVLARSLVPLGFSAVLFIFLLTGAVLLAAPRAKRSYATLAACAFIAFGIGMVRMDSAALAGDPFLDSHTDQRVTLLGEVFQEPDVREGSVRLSVRVVSAASSTPVHAAVLAVVSAHTNVAFGDTVRIEGEVRVPEDFDTGAGRTFKYRGYLAASGIGYEVEQARVEVVRGSPHFSPLFYLTAAAIDVKQVFLRGMQHALSEPQAGLAGGITAGEKRGLGQELTDEFRNASLVHIIVLSGYNITIVANALMAALAGLPRFVRFGAGGAVAIFFALMTGGASASVRAAIMAGIAMSAQVNGRIYRADRALLVAAVAMAAWDPFVVVFDPGYQLSVVATTGLIYLSPFIAPWAARIPEKFGLREICISTTSAQLAVLPLLLYQSGQLSLVALPANLLVLPIIPWAMLLSSIAAVAGVIVPFAAPVIALPAHIVLSYVIDMASFLGSLPFAALQIPAFGGWLLASVYGALAIIVFALRKSPAPKGAGREEPRAKP